MYQLEGLLKGFWVLLRLEIVKELMEIGPNKVCDKSLFFLVIVQLKCNNLEDRLFEDYKENLMEFSINCSTTSTVCLFLS